MSAAEMVGDDDDDSSVSLGNVSFQQTEITLSSTSTTTTTTTTTTTAAATSGVSSSCTTSTIQSEGELFWLQLRRQWTTRRRVGDTPAQSAAHDQLRGAGVLKSINGGAALDDFLCARSKLTERISLADMVSLLHDVWEEDATTL
jgi:hypothetical protein